MSVIYTRSETLPNWMKMDRLEVQIWNVLSDSPLNAWEIYTRLPKTSYSDIIKALARMEKEGNVNARYSQ